MRSLLLGDETHLLGLPSLRPITSSGEVDVVPSFSGTVFLRPAVNNQSFIDGTFRDRKRDTFLGRGPVTRFTHGSSLGPSASRYNGNNP
jgi:hypothetical protein